ncbi:helicase-related protein [Verrucomicrobium sp. BvORR106]|uniref:helicase-related protein n=1 Tax=Verrucomicrobium sp. BvORR106 TaxID=1403819 RepID=UPI00056FED05|nr:helicase-related protein [Verrucomicrobium sp. BvORR106]
MTESPSPALASLRDNRPTRGTVGDFLKQEILPDSILSFVSAYFTVHAYQALAEQLENADHLRFLFGEPTFISGIDKGGKQSANFKLTENGLTIAKTLVQGAAARACAAWIDRMVQIRSIRQSNFLHGKAYHIQNGNASSAILGSSNFTVPGLGLGPNSNIELNLIVDSDRDRRDLKAWFDEVWTDERLTKDVKQEVLTYLNRLSAPNSPQFIYFLTLYHLFRGELEGAKETDDNLRTSSLLEANVWKMLYSFQKDGVKGAINKIRDYNGCILADSVGLGKTFEALAVIKYFELRNEKVLVLCPKKLRQNWTVFRSNSRLNPLLDDRFAFDVLSHTDLSRTSGMTGDHDLANFHWDNYGLVVIDESHNFRNNAVGKPNDDGTSRRTRYERLLEDVIQSGQKTKVLLLSATPVNNGISDLRNQISFIAGGDVARSADPTHDGAFKEKLGIPSVKETTRKAQAKFTLWTKKPAEQRKSRDLIHELGSDFFHLLDGLTIARSRAQIKRYYSQEMEKLGGFPKRNAPLAEYPHIDLNQEFLSFEELDRRIGELTLSLYHPSTKLKKDLPPQVRAHYEQKIGNFNQAGRERILIAMMKINFLKRLESSIDSFRLTLARTIEKIDRLEMKLQAFQEARSANPQLDFANLSEDDFDDLDLDPEDLEIGGKHKINLSHLNLPDWLLAVRLDRDQLQNLLDHANPVTVVRDAKLTRVREIITEKVKRPGKNKDGKPVRKVIIFTAFADTARYLYEHLAPYCRDTLGVHSALICGGGKYKTSLGGNDFEQILTNFSPISKKRDKQRQLPQDEEIDLLIATDCISEGQNLQDADLLINYDIHWNPVRIIQRFGRIDRIGSKNKTVSLVNFWPTKDLDAYLNVKNRVEDRMALVDLTASGEDNLLASDQIEDLIKTDLHYRNQQLKRLQNEILDLEELEDEMISLADFSLTDFRLDLLKFLENNREQLESAELGLYAIVPPDPQLPASQPGILFCLRQRDDKRSTEVNPLAPHYLVYVLDDGNVRLTFMQPKQCLELFRVLAAGYPSAFTDLCDAFDTRTQNGEDMSQASKLLESAVASIKRSFTKRATASLFSGRDGLLPKASETPSSTDDMELITWLVISNPLK